MADRTNAELADELEASADYLHRKYQGPIRVDRAQERLRSAAARLRSMPEGKIIGYVPLEGFHKAASAGGLADPRVPASLTPIWRDSLPVIHNGEDKSE